ncbi:MAG: hypothetical protein ACRCYX_07140 [Dermatophilaceae bacterium]
MEPRGQCQEYWVVGRHGMAEYLPGARLPKPQKPAKAKGAIYHELSAMLVAASRPTPQDVFLDPFAGTGSFPLARLELPARQVVYSDVGLARFRRELPRQLTDGTRVRLLDEDALALPTMADGLAGAELPPDAEHEVLVNGHPATVLTGHQPIPEQSEPVPTLAMPTRTAHPEPGRGARPVLAG